MEERIRIQIKYLSIIRDQVGIGQEEVDFPKGSNLQAIVKWLNEHYSLSLPNSEVITTLNGKGWDQYASKSSTKISAGDVICLLPIVSGG